jgi:hypothetical protein
MRQPLDILIEDSGAVPVEATDQCQDRHGIVRRKGNVHARIIARDDRAVKPDSVAQTFRFA